MNLNEDDTKKFQMEYIGKSARITIHNQSFEGKIIDETKNTITIQTQKAKKKIIKNQAKIEIEDQIINGKKIMKRPEERIKLK